MLVKASILATVAVCAVVSLSQIDYRQLYNEMYPVNGLRRDVLNLCHEAQPTFVRAVEADRIGCYDGMPDPVERAIGWVRTSSRLAAMHAPTPVEKAEKLLISAVTEGRLGRVAEAPQFTGYPALTAPPPQTCAGGRKTLLLAANQAGPRLSSAARDDAQILATVGLAMPGQRNLLGQDRELPVLSLGGAGDSGAPGTSPLDPIAAGSGGGDGGSLPLPAAAAGCRTPA